MKRKIKFRGWDKKIKRLCFSGEQRPYGSYTNHFILQYFPSEDVTQFTGLKDINGKDIYENDIVRIWHEDYPEEKLIGKVIWNLGGEYPAFDIYIPTDRHNLAWDAYSDEYNSFSCPEHCIEIIGNTFQTPELIKK